MIIAQELISCHLQCNCRAVGNGGSWGPPPILVDNLTLFQPGPGVGHIIPTSLLLPRIFRPSYGPVNKRNRIPQQEELRHERQFQISIKIFIDLMMSRF